MGILEAGGEFRHLLGFCLETERRSKQSVGGCSQTSQLSHGMPGQNDAPRGCTAGALVFRDS